MTIPDGVMFNAYPDSCGKTLGDAAALLARPELDQAFRYFYILPSMFQSDIDRGFSVISYELDEELSRPADLTALQNSGIELKLDFVLNHLSTQSPQFRDLLANGDDSPYVEFFLDWNAFWRDKGTTAPEGHVVPEERYLSALFMRKPGLPIMSVPFPDGSTRYYWNTFYQDAAADPPLAQMDLNAQSPAVWEFYDRTLKRLAGYGARIVRLDAFAYLHKQAGKSNFFNEPGTWEYLARVRETADRLHVALLPEIHAKYSDGTHRKLHDAGYPFYDFFLPGLILHAIETGDGATLAAWLQEVVDEGYSTVNMLGCHDGIPVLDVAGLLDEAEIDVLIQTMLERGGRVKNLYGPDGKKISYYQVNTTFYNALGENPQKLLLARAIQLFAPGIPQVWYLDLFAGTNDYAAADAGGHKEINRTNLSTDEIERRLDLPVVRSQLELIRFRSTFPAFGPESRLQVDRGADGAFTMKRSRGGNRATLTCNLRTHSFDIRVEDGSSQRGDHMAD